MSMDKPLKSSVELALERMRARDEQSGTVVQALTDEQKAAIAEIRNLYDSKIAEQDVLCRSQIQRTYDVAGREALEQEFRRERERLTTERDAKVEKIRRGEQPNQPL